MHGSMAAGESDVQREPNENISMVDILSRHNHHFD